ncbi:low affinity immunoglobulin gamma Fc region receptor II-like isoform X2 [Embiotoca jacksoni]|uniref:low affinity immunoglobulin gamma Fc region receptor II-like isoform X2 n=1 Tax=Embiotoca jacksoni TaxID=100190 RepID=UPI00370405F9
MMLMLPIPSFPVFPAACLRVSPDSSQFFRQNSISLSCEDQLNSTSWKVKRKTLEGGVGFCSSNWGSASSASTCTVTKAYPSDSGAYWCESVSGERSDSANVAITGTAHITFTVVPPGMSSFKAARRAVGVRNDLEERLFSSKDGAVILESPALPVSEGAAVTLRCKAKRNSFNHKFHFSKDGHSITSNSTGQMTIHRVSKSDEGLYKCSISGGEESSGSWLVVVQASPAPTSSAPPAASCSFSVIRLVCHLVAGTPYLLSTILLGLLYRDRKRAQTGAERRSSADVIMEIVVQPDFYLDN